MVLFFKVILNHILCSCFQGCVIILPLMKYFKTNFFNFNCIEYIFSYFYVYCFFSFKLSIIFIHKNSVYVNYIIPLIGLLGEGRDVKSSEFFLFFFLLASLYHACKTLSVQKSIPVDVTQIIFIYKLMFYCLSGLFHKKISN